MTPLGQGRSCPVTILFVDVRGFTALARQWSPPELVSMMNQFFETATDILLYHDACIDKFMGDQIMAVFGAPIQRPDHASQAVQAAREILQSVRAFDHSEKGSPSLSLGLAVHTGIAVVGNVGSLRVRDFTAMGDTVNLAAHLQQQAGAGEILVTEAAEAELAEPLTAFEKRTVTVKGADAPVQVRVVRL
jgi:adenylate cyclase